MSNQSRGRLAATYTPPPEPEPVPGWRDRVRDAMETAGTPGLSKLVGLILEDKERSENRAATPPQSANDDAYIYDPPSSAELEIADRARRRGDPAAYERAVLSAMGTRPMYAGTVEPWRVEHRRRRNKAARAARRINRRKVRT